MPLLTPVRCGLRPHRTSWLLAVLAIAMGPAAFAAKPAWQPIPPGELADATPRGDPAAAAEILLLKIEMDDRGFPHTRKLSTHIRYKIYDPQNTEEITRVSDIEIPGSLDRTEMYARLISPDGRVQEFGKESIRERPLLQQARQAGFLGWLAGSGDAAAKERFLAVSGVERGSILEYYFHHTEAYPGLVSVAFGQRQKFPVRKLEYRARLVSDSNFRHRTFVTNGQSAQLQEEPKARTITVSGSNLPAATLEPFSGPLTNQILTIVNCYEQSTLYLLPRSGKVKLPGKVEASAGPWAPYATLMDWAARDRALATKRTEALAAEITRGASTAEAKAEAIHTWVTREAQTFRREPPLGERKRPPHSLDEVLDWRKEREAIINIDEFLWLALNLYRAAGLETQLILLPDRSFSGFDINAVSPVFLPHLAIALQLGGEWRFSAPHTAAGLPFGLLAWQNEGQPGLLALPQQQQFIPVPTAEPQRSLRGTASTLTLHSDGVLEGEMIRRLTGHLAVPVRAALLEAAEAERPQVARTQLGLDVPEMDLTIKRIDGLDDPEKPVDIVCHVRWPDFAARTRDRLVLRPLVFRTDARTPFTALERKRPVYFPFRWQELDQISITLPRDYELESPSRPEDVPSASLYYKVDFAWDASKWTMSARRQFMSNIVGVAPENYVGLREFYNHVAAGDQHEVVLRKRAATAASQ